ncbi:MAG: RluA family pseudouridine synthase [Pseudomonadota bacterium]
MAEAKAGSGAGVRRLTVAADEAEQRLDRWLKRRLPELTQGRIEKLLRKGEIRVDGGRAKASDRLGPGAEIRIPPLAPRADADAPPRRPPAKPISDADAALVQGWVLHRDDAVLALAKPPGLPVQGGSGQTRHLDGLLDALRFDRDDRPRLVHRLDKDTSGVLVLGRTPAAAAKLAQAFRARDARKLYWAALSGTPKPRMGEIRYALLKAPGHGPHGAGEKMLCVAPDLKNRPEGAQAALTLYAVLDALGDRACWAALRPVTGRTHQLRAHMAEIGCPVVGDGKYGTNRVEKQDGRYGAQLGGEISRKLHLHARALDLAHPDGGRLRLSAPLPEHMRRTWESFGWDPDAAAEDPFEEAS